MFDEMTVETVEGFISSGQREHLQLEFKTTLNARMDKKEDRRNLARILSGFANSNGGITIWGIDARGQGAAYTVTAAPIKAVREFVRRLDTLAGEAVSPSVDGVRHRELLTADDEGFALTLVPESASGPHMAKLGEDRYFKRNGESFYRLEHFDLEDMFGRRMKPELGAAIFDNVSDDDGRDVEILVVVQNVGRGVAKHVELMVTLGNCSIVRVGGSFQNLTLLNGAPSAQYKDDIGVIHGNGRRTTIGTLLVRREIALSPITVFITLYCEGVAPQFLHFEAGVPHPL